MAAIVLVNPNNRVPAPFSACEPPLWLGLIAGYYKGKGLDVQVVDAEAEGLTVEHTVERVRGWHPDETIIVCMGANPSVSSTPKWPVTRELLKHLDAKVTGLHPVAMNYMNTIKRPFEGCPSVPWQLLPMSRYKAHNWHCLGYEDRSNYAVLYTSLNCPFSCSYCNVHTLYGDRTVRYRPMQDILAELDLFHLLGIKHIKIWDELFCLDEERVNDICSHIITYGYNFNIWAYARTDTVSPRMLHRMKRAGINWLAYGFESASDKKCVKAEEAIKATEDAGIHIMGNFIFGLGDDKASLAMAIRHNFEYVNFYVGLPYPGSQWYEKLKDKPDDWRRFGQYEPDMYGEPEVIKFKDEAFRTYFSRPEYQSMIGRKFGLKAVDHIQEMLKWKIRDLHR